MFKLVVNYLGFLKHVPGLPLLFDSCLLVYTFITKPAVLNYIQQIEDALLQQNGVTKTLHKYGGTQFNYNGRELCHIHSNGLLDMVLTKKRKQQLLAEGRVTHHHIFPNSGWISFSIQSHEDAVYAIALLRF